MRALHPDVDCAHLAVVEILRAGAAEYGKANGFVELIRVSSTRGQGAGNGVGIERDHDCDARAARHARRVRALRIDREALVDIRGHRRGRVQAHFPWPVARVVGPGNDVAVFFRRGLIALHTLAAPRARVKGQNHRPLTRGGEVRREIERVVLRGVVLALDIPDDFSSGQVLR